VLGQALRFVADQNGACTLEQAHVIVADLARRMGQPLVDVARDLLEGQRRREVDLTGLTASGGCPDVTGLV
jgi:hypothetical protein